VSAKSGGREVGGGKYFGAEKRLKKPIILGREDVFLVHPQNGFNGYILNWCIGGCWFTLALVDEGLDLLVIYNINESSIKTTSTKQ
jgi:hypothetical protein